jgi:hypothetical protein
LIFYPENNFFSTPIFLLQRIQLDSE